VVHTSPPISLIFISFSISTICCSSAKANAHGTPNNNALVLTTHSVLPPNKSPDLIQPAVVSTLPVIYDRVVGGIMSRSASNRSVSVSSSGTLSSSSVEISESEDYVRIAVMAYVQETNRYQCSSPRRSLQAQLA
jgi:hypothetical protein